MTLMLAIELLAWALVCATWVAALARVATGGRAAAQPPAPETVRVREEDLVRPAVGRDGEPIWVEADEAWWYEIVAWPPRRGSTESGDTALSG